MVLEEVHWLLGKADGATSIAISQFPLMFSTYEFIPLELQRFRYY